jgi:hypothetical protein
MANFNSGENMNTETTTTTASVAPKAPKAPKIEQNGVVRPCFGTKTARVWEVADSISTNLSAPVPRAELLAAVASEGINASTAATQYGKWRKFNGLEREKKPAAAPADAPAAETDVTVE